MFDKKHKILQTSLDDCKKQIVEMQNKIDVEGQINITLQNKFDVLYKQYEDLQKAIQTKNLINGHSQYYYDSEFSNIERMRIKKFCPDNDKNLLELKGKFSGKRCFIIGNGPSLKAKDLDKLKNEYTFACNRIDLIFKDTVWRPTFYAVTDILFFDNASIGNLDTFKSSTKLFCSKCFREESKYFKDVIYFVRNCMYRKIPEFSSDAMRLLYEGGSVTYVNLQLAAYMGFTEIYLLGVDNNYNTKVLEDGRLVFDFKNSHFTNEYVKDGGFDSLEEWVDLNNRFACGMYDLNDSYAVAKQYLERLNIKIYNATRGGELEAFERIQFDDIKL